MAFVCLPVVVSRLGPERSGLLALSWASVGSAQAFDFGLGRAAARFIAAALGRDASDDVPRILGSVLLVQLGLGVAGGVLIAAAAPVVVARVFALPGDLQAEARVTLQVVALAVPIALATSSLRGALFAAQRFDLGSSDVVVVNFPTTPYDHANPDKYRLPLDTDLIPYSFGNAAGW